MTSRTPFVIEVIAGDAERAAFAAAAKQLQAALEAAGGAPWPVRLQWHGGDNSASPPGAIVMSLVHECDRLEEPWAQVEARLRRDAQALSQRGPAVFVCTIFRHVAEETVPREGVPAARPRERIRRLNLLAAMLSHDLGIYVVDIDRVLAGIGARALAGDGMLGGPLAASFAGHAIAFTLIAAGLDECFPADVQERAKQWLADRRPEIPRTLELAVSPVTLGFQTVRMGKRRQVFAQHAEGFLPQSLTVAERWHRLRNQLENGQLTTASAAIVVVRSAGRSIAHWLSFGRWMRE